ncbi:MAG: hypothetical protein EZS28_047021 [Streblomastix strix]|uniref:Uncharacterized protein n=1 Tax=Streblomastix strix TaxID=222440 RepID=A0A5J4TI54_9EUKA|nr:MAG: hypothetical protein EZS28_047021 [Streblomastix strix]
MILKVRRGFAEIVILLNGKTQVQFWNEVFLCIKMESQIGFKGDSFIDDSRREVSTITSPGPAPGMRTDSCRQLKRRTVKQRSRLKTSRRWRDLIIYLLVVSYRKDDRPYDCPSGCDGGWGLNAFFVLAQDLVFRHNQSPCQGIGGYDVMKRKQQFFGLAAKLYGIRTKKLKNYPGALQQQKKQA